MKEPAHQPKPDRELSVLLRRYSVVQVDGFSIDLASAPGRWDSCLKRMGPDRAYDEMAQVLCRIYRERFGEPFLLSEACVAHEIKYHADAYLAVQGYRKYSRPFSTLLFTRDAIRLHCGEINISLGDLGDWKQRMLFRYRKGIRECYRKKEKDPFQNRSI